MIGGVQFLLVTVIVGLFQHGWKHRSIISICFIKKNKLHLTRAGNRKIIKWITFCISVFRIFAIIKKRHAAEML